MTAYDTVTFLHVASAVGLFAVLAIEGISLRGVGRSRTYEEPRQWSGLWNLLMPAGLPATLVVLASGIYLASVAGMWRLGWVAVSLPTYAVIVVGGGVAGPRRNRAQASLATGTGDLPSDLRRQLRHPLLIASWRSRATLLSGLLFVMIVKPPWALSAIGVSAVLGGAWSVPAWLGFRDSAPQHVQEG